MIFFTSDLHLSHEKILSIGSGRPFASIEEMNNTIYDKWNSKVSKDDTVYVLGDVFWNQNSTQIKNIMSKLNGYKFLVSGNHDRMMPNIKSNAWFEIVQYKELDINGRKIVLSHYPIFEWNGFYYHSVHLYGHVHGHMNLAQYTLSRGNGNCWDVGVDNNGFEPISYEEVLEKIENNKKQLEGK